MNDNSKTKKTRRHQNILESLKDLGGDTAGSLKGDVIKTQEIMSQLFGVKIPDRKYTGEITPGESVEINDIYSGKREEDTKLKNQLNYERQLLQEERILVENKTNELKIQLKVVMQEIQNLANSTQNLAEEIQIASMQAPVEPGLYHVIFFEKLLEFIKSFKLKVDDAVIWLSSVNKRAQKQNYWSSYKKHGSKFLLSSEHYLTRSAG